MTIADVAHEVSIYGASLKPPTGRSGPAYLLRRFFREQLGRTQASAPLNGRPWFPSAENLTLIRGSQLPYFCPRLEMLLIRDGPIAEKISPELGFTFMVGRVLHLTLQNFVLAPLLLGGWRCLRCGKCYGYCPPDSIEELVALPVIKASQFVPRPRQCKKCGGKVFEYVEPAFADLSLGLSAHLDGLIDLGGRIYLLEIKSMADWRFNLLSDSLLEAELVQMGGYNLLLRRRSAIRIAGGLLVRVSKKLDSRLRLTDLEFFEVEMSGDVEKVILEKISCFRKACQLYSSGEWRLPPPVCSSPRDFKACVKGEVCRREIAGAAGQLEGQKEVVLDVSEGKGECQGESAEIEEV